jgi:hypothetical protein
MIYWPAWCCNIMCLGRWTAERVNESRKSSNESSILSGPAFQSDGEAK